MHTFAALEQLATDARMCDSAVSKDRARNREGSLGVVSRLAEQPFALLAASVPWNDRARWPFESIDAVRIPALNIFTGEVLSLFANRVARGDAVQAGENSGLHCVFHYAKTSRKAPGRAPPQGLTASCHLAITVVVVVDVLFASSGSGVDAVTLAVFVNVPAFEGLTTMVTMAGTDGSIMPRAHVTRPSDLPLPDRVHDPWLAVADTNVTSGNWSVSVTPLAAPEPRLFTVIVYVRFARAVTGSGESLLFTLRSAASRRSAT